MHALEQMHPSRRNLLRNLPQREARPTHHDPLRQLQKPLWLTPPRQVQKAVRPYQHEQLRVRHLLPQRRNAVHAIVRRPIRMRCIHRRHRETRVQRAGQRRHRQPVGEARQRLLQLQRLPPRRSEQHPVERERVRRRSRNRQMSPVDRIEGAPQQRHAHKSKGLIAYPKSKTRNEIIWHLPPQPDSIEAQGATCPQSKATSFCSLPPPPAKTRKLKTSASCNSTLPKAGSPTTSSSATEPTIARTSRSPTRSRCASSATSAPSPTPSKVAARASGS